MSSLALSFKNPYLAAPSGLTVEAWAASDFTAFPTNPAAYPPNASAVASGTTDASGNCTLTGLTIGTSYYVSIVDESHKPTFFNATGYVGGGTLMCRYYPDAVAAVSAPSSGGQLVFEARMSGGGIAETGSPQVIDFGTPIYDPLSGSDGVGYTVPAALNGKNLWLVGRVEDAGTPPAGGGGQATNGFIYFQQNSAVLTKRAYFVINGAGPTYQTLDVESAILACATGDALTLNIQGISGGSMAFGADLTGTGYFYTRFYVFSC